MTAMEAKERFADESGYVSCYNCPIHDERCTMNSATGYQDCWEEIEKHFNVNDNVNHPSHYETGKFECIDVMREAIGLESTKAFCLCNAFKYIYRCNKKHEKPVEDVKKAVWYLNKFLELEGEADD